MSFPLNPINGQTTTTNNITYIYSSSNTAWTRVPTTLTLNTGSSSGGTAASGTGTTSTFVIQNTTQSTGTNSGALQVYGGAGIGGNLYVGGNIVGGGVRSTTTSTQPTTATVGDIWYLQGTDIVYRYEFDGTNSYWIDFNGPTVLVSGTGTVSGGTGGTSSVFNGGTVTNTTTFLTPIIIGTGTTTATQVSLAVLGTDAVQLPVGTTAQRPTNASPGMIRYNSSSTYGFEIFMQSGTSSGWISIVAPVYSVNYLIVAGGGSGGVQGGGGAGGLLTGVTPVTMGATYSIVVGGGGTGVGPSTVVGLSLIHI